MANNRGAAGRELRQRIVFAELVLQGKRQPRLELMRLKLERLNSKVKAIKTVAKLGWAFNGVD